MILDIESILLFDNIKDKLSKETIILKTKILLEDIENKLCKILDKHSETAKYYINISENSWVVSFNVDISQFEAMCKTMFNINIYNENNYTVVCLSNEVKEHPQWEELYNYILKKLNQ
jgi:hypothetical protein